LFTISPASAIASKVFGFVRDHLDEHQRRLLLGAFALAAGHGEITQIAEIVGVACRTIRLGRQELTGQRPSPPNGRVRHGGGGRKRLQDADPELITDLERLVEPTTRGEPDSPLLWTSKSAKHLAKALQEMGHRVSGRTVTRLLHEMGYSLQANAKLKEGKQHPDRDAQFLYLNEQVRQHQAEGAPVLSVDTKKKELVGEFKNGGREWQPKGRPEAVNVHDFPSQGVGKAIPYGIYDVSRNRGWVSVGIDHDTACFAVEALRRWWRGEGRATYAAARRLLICADGGGSNDYRSRLWKVELARLAREAGLEITVCHLPPGTSKWNKIEHRMFAHISLNWRGRPLTSHQTVVELIGATTTRQGLRIHSELDPDSYPTGLQVSDAVLACVPITRHDFHGEWNYTISPPGRTGASPTESGSASTGPTQTANLDPPTEPGLARPDHGQAGASPAPPTAPIPSSSSSRRSRPPARAA
jgi:transposase